MSFDLVNQVYEMDDLPSSEKALLVFLAHKAHNDGTSIFPGIQAMMIAIGYKKCHTLNLLRKLKEKGYIVQVNHAGGPRHTASLCIPLNAARIITPRPIPEEDLLEEKEQRKRKKTARQLKELIDIEEEELPAASAPAPKEEPRHLPAAAMVDQALPDARFMELEILYFGTLNLQARCPPNSLDWQRFGMYLACLGAQYTEACAARGIVLADTGGEPVVVEAEEEEAQRNPLIGELQEIIATRTAAREKYAPGSRKYNMMTRLINRATNQLNDVLFGKEYINGYTT